MKLRVSAACLYLGVAALACLCATASAEPPKPDGGKFTLLLNGKSVGADTFRLLPDGCDSDVHLAAGPGQDLQFHQTLKYKKGQWGQVVTDAGPLGTMTLALAGPRSSLKIGDKPAVVQKLPVVAYPYGDHSPHLWAYVLSAYDGKKGGEQKFDLLYSEGVGPKGVVVLAAVLKQPELSVKQIGGKPVSIARYPLTVNGPAGPITMEVFTDKDKHVLFWNVPAQKYSAVRSGYEDLAR